MKKIFLFLMAAVFCISIFSVAIAVKPPAVDSVLPDIKLAVPQISDHKSYLGLKKDGFFTVSQVKAKVVIIEIMSMYCPHCQTDAPKVNKLYHLINNDPGLKDKIKLIGIGAGNSPYELKVFTDTYDVPFPLIPDNDFTIHTTVGDVRTPYLIGVKIDDGTPHVFYSRLGGVKDPNQFLQLMIKLSGLR